MKTLLAMFPLVALSLVLCGCGGKSKTLRLTREDLEAHRHVLVVPAGPVVAQLDVGLPGKALLKGLEKILENDPKGSFAESLRELGFLPRDTTAAAAVAALQELGWQTALHGEAVEEPGKKFDKVALPAALCPAAAAAGADSVLLLRARLVLDIGATEALARTDHWGHFFSCPEGKLLWRGKDRRKLSLNRFIVDAAKAAIEKKTTLADFLGSLTRLAQDSGRELVRAGLSR